MLNFLDFKINNQNNDPDFSCQSGSRKDMDTIEFNRPAETTVMFSR